uniref:Uncharacterized protein n=1 Tax=Anopheles maculatus TaxID=74869 RepID=A0A182TBA5_9DIPT
MYKKLPGSSMEYDQQHMRDEETSRANKRHHYAVHHNADGPVQKTPITQASSISTEQYFRPKDGLHLQTGWILRHLLLPKSTMHTKNEKKIFLSSNTAKVRAT